MVFAEGWPAQEFAVNTADIVWNNIDYKSFRNKGDHLSTIAFVFIRFTKLVRLFHPKPMKGLY